MKQVLINLFSFSGLSEEARQTALDEMRYTNVAHEWWEFVYEDFKILAVYLGIAVDLKKTYFSGFYHQGQGSSFTATVDISKMLDGLQNRSWKQYAPQQDFHFPDTAIGKRIQDLLKRKVIDASASVTPSKRGTAIDVWTDIDYSRNQCVNYERIDAQLSRLEELAEEVCRELNHFLFTTLQSEYEYLTSDEAVKESIECNDYSFTKDGKPAFCIERLAEQQSI